MPTLPVNPCSPRTAYSFLMLAKRRVDDAHVEQNLARIGDLVEFAKRVVEFIVVVAAEGRDPRLDFL